MEGAEYEPGAVDQHQMHRGVSRGIPGKNLWGINVRRGRLLRSGYRRESSRDTPPHGPRYTETRGDGPEDRHRRRRCDRRHGRFPVEERRRPAFWSSVWWAALRDDLDAAHAFTHALVVGDGNAFADRLHDPIGAAGPAGSATHGYA